MDVEIRRPTEATPSSSGGACSTPWTDPDLPSLVVLDKRGRIVGFIGARGPHSRRRREHHHQASPNEAPRERGLRRRLDTPWSPRIQASGSVRLFGRVAVAQIGEPATSELGRSWPWPAAFADHRILLVRLALTRMRLNFVAAVRGVRESALPPPVTGVMRYRRHSSDPDGSSPDPARECSPSSVLREARRRDLTSGGPVQGSISIAGLGDRPLTQARRPPSEAKL
jgi:hypothetical protein